MARRGSVSRGTSIGRGTSVSRGTSDASIGNTGRVGTQSSQCKSSSPSIQSNPNVVAQTHIEQPDKEVQPSADEPVVEKESVVGVKRKDSSRASSQLWKTFTKCKLPNSDKLDPDFCTCNICGLRVPCSSIKNGTSSMWNHVNRNCPKHPLNPPAQSDPKQTRLNMENVSSGRPHKYNKKRCDDKCVEMTIKDELPFRHVEKEGFRAFAKELQPEWHPLNRKQIAQGVLDKFAYEKGILLSGLKAADTRVSITTDTWTSIQNINYMVVTGHFLDSEWVLHKRILSFCQIGSHKGEDIGIALELCLRQWEITKVFTITVDNASPNNIAVQYIKRRLRGMKTLLFDGDFLHLRCSCHVINLVVRDGLKELESEISAIWNCAKYIRSSPARLEKFREFAVLENCRANANVPLDVVTRWNSTYLMLEAALKYESVFGRMAEEDDSFISYFASDDRVGPPSYEDWRNAEAFCFFLKMFYDSTVRLSAWKSITANVMIVEMVKLRREIDNVCTSDDYDEVMKKEAKSMRAKFDKYWGNFASINQIVLIANILDPRNKLQWVKTAMGKTGASAEAISSTLNELKTLLCKLYEAYKGDDLPDEQMPSDDAYMDGVELEELDEVSREIARERLVEQTQCIKNEVDQYLSDKYVSYFVKGFDIAKWWKGNETTYPVLSKLAKDVLAIPSSTVPSENAFSLGSRIVDPFRACLTPTMVEALVCTSDWLRAEPYSFYKDPTEDELELYYECEELEKAQGCQNATQPTPLDATGRTGSSALTSQTQMED